MFPETVSGPPLRRDPDTNQLFYQDRNMNGNMEWYPYNEFDPSNDQNSFVPYTEFQSPATDDAPYNPRTLPAPLPPPLPQNQPHYVNQFEDPFNLWQPFHPIAESMSFNQDNTAHSSQYVRPPTNTYPTAIQQEDFTRRFGRLGLSEYTHTPRDDGHNSSSVIDMNTHRNSGPVPSLTYFRGTANLDLAGFETGDSSVASRGKGKLIAGKQTLSQSSKNSATSFNKGLLSSDYKMRPFDHKRFFRPGRVLETPLVEQYSETTNPTSPNVHVFSGPYRLKYFCKTRIFVVVRQHDTCCTCLPVTSFGGNAHKLSNKVNLGLIYSLEPAPQLCDGMTKEPVRVILSKENAIEMSAYSAIDYSIPQTIQSNWKVKDIGKLDPDSLKHLTNYFLQTMAPDLGYPGGCIENTLLQTNTLPEEKTQSLMGITGGVQPNFSEALADSASTSIEGFAPASSNVTEKYWSPGLQQSTPEDEIILPTLDVVERLKASQMVRPSPGDSSHGPSSRTQKQVSWPSRSSSEFEKKKPQKRHRRGREGDTKKE